MPDHKRDRAIGIILTVFILGMLGLFASLGVFSDRSSSSTSGNSTTANNYDCANNSRLYLLALKEGKPVASGYWKPGIRPKRLFDVRDYREIKGGPLLTRTNQEVKLPRFYYEYAVESATKGGIPIRKRWAVIMEHSENYSGKGCAIVDLREAE
jgi:hypothetical protein